ncbi:MAG TPA: hypothetical protein VKS01_06665, partial [Bryobacteraceae bacterium]|nr:hypothetical protein [Bryobacteraceae bacterium]
MASSSGRVGLGILFAACMFLEVRFTAESIGQNLHVTQLARAPFALKTPEGTLEQPLEPEAKAAKFTVGDRLLTLDGHPATGHARIGRISSRHRPGDIVEATVERGGVRYSAPVKLAPLKENPLTAGDWTLAIFLLYLTPWFCIVLGFAVAFLRPTDPLAWLLLLLMLSFGEV